MIDNLIAYNVVPECGILLAGMPGHPIEDVVLSNVQIHYAGGGTDEQAARDVPELETSYPDPSLFGILLSWGIFARHVKNLQVRGAEFRTLNPDARPAIVLDDVQDARFANTIVAADPAALVWSFKNVQRLHVREVTRLSNGDFPDTIRVLR